MKHPSLNKSDDVKVIAKVASPVQADGSAIAVLGLVLLLVVVLLINGAMSGI